MSKGESARGKQLESGQGTAGGNRPGRKTGRKLFFMRHAERMDRIFPGWTRLAYTEEGKYQPYDLNQPLFLPNRQGGTEEYDADCPITEMGFVTSQMVGRGMKLTKFNLGGIYTSPALRCVQTGQGILKTFGGNLKMRVEPGLFEWLSWYKTVPKWFSAGELAEASYQVDPDYKPIMSVEDMVQRENETALEHYKRVGEVTEKILEKHKVSEPVLVIGHGTTVDAGTRKILRKQAKEIPGTVMDRLGVYFPYSCLVGVEETAKGDWTVIHDPLPQISYLDATNRINQDFFNRA